jgi:hypothetical protein
MVSFNLFIFFLKKRERTRDKRIYTMKDRRYHIRLIGMISLVIQIEFNKKDKRLTLF